MNATLDGDLCIPKFDHWFVSFISGCLIALTLTEEQIKFPNKRY
jgi:hypothetical protein